MHAAHSLLLLCFLHAGTCYITRLPECMYFANFTKRLPDKYFTSPVILTVEDVSRDECTLYCTTNDECLFVNYETDGSRCELLRSHVGNLTDKPGWMFVSTNYDDWKYRGKNCYYIRPACDLDKSEICADTCEHPGYKCQTLENLALSGKKMAPGSYPHAASLGADGNPNTAYDTWYVSSRPPNWWGVDVGETKKILSVQIHVCNSLELMHHINILIGDNDEGRMDENAICVANHVQKKKKENYICTNGFLFGRYVFIKKTTSQPFKFCEVHVSAF